MKTQKDICKKCISEECDPPWSSFDEKRWEGGSVKCPANYHKTWHRNLSQFPPVWCPYAAEHVVLRDEG